MTIVDFGSDFVTYDSTKDGQIATITGEGEASELVYKGVTKDVYNIPVEIESKARTWTPTMKAGRVCVEAWGEDTKDWIGKQFEIVHLDNKIHIRPK